MDTLDKNNVKIHAPFRGALIGKMNTGKSTFVYNFIRNIKKLTDIEDDGEILFCFTHRSSEEGFKNAAEEIGFQFSSNQGLPDPKELAEHQENSNKRPFVLILEDLQHTFSTLPRTVQTNWCNFLLTSRHDKISLILILHGFPIGLRKNYFCSELLDNSSFIVLFQSFFNDSIQLSLFCNKYFNVKKEVILKCLSIAKELSVLNNNRPYIFINMDQEQVKNIKLCHRFRLDLFNRNLIINSKSLD